ncbi:MAG: hypothetical protein RIR49_1951 [Actinomycetota bacterium]
MAVRFVLDTSVLTRLRFESVRAMVRPIVSWGLAGRVTITDLELGHSARNGGEWERIQSGLSELDAVEIDGTHIARAREVQRALAHRGLRGRAVPDLLIAAAAEHAGATVVHYDRDFDVIATVTGQSTRWVVPAGSVD